MENALDFASCNYCHNDTYRSIENALHDVAEDDILSLVLKRSYLLNIKKKTSHKNLLVFQIFIKVAHHTWIKFLQSRPNTLMMKNKVTYDRYECTKSK